MNPTKKYRKYEDYLLEDFLVDEFFIEWVKTPSVNNIHFWEKWISEHPHKRKLIQTASDFIQRVGYQNIYELSDRRYVEIFENVVRESPASIENTNPGPISLRKWIFSIRQLAAVFLIGVSILYLWVVKPEIQTLTNESVEQIELVRKTTPKGQKATYLLEDGSKIYLNSNSELIFPKKFGTELRQITLRGEAFFEVAEESRPFIVESGEVAVEVLGTTFNVKHNPNGSLEVALLTGKVRIEDQKGNRLMLTPNEMMVFDQSGEFRKTGFDPVEKMGWKDKTLVFKNNSISEVKNTLENWFGVEISLNGNFPANWSYSGIYQDETLENVLLGLSRTTELTFTLKEKKVEITHQ